MFGLIVLWILMFDCFVCMFLLLVDNFYWCLGFLWVSVVCGLFILVILLDVLLKLVPLVD